MSESEYPLTDAFIYELITRLSAKGPVDLDEVRRELLHHAHTLERRLRALERRTYAYGIVDKDGKAWFEEACISDDRASMDETVRDLNGGRHDERCPYRVVRLVFQE